MENNLKIYKIESIEYPEDNKIINNKNDNLKTFIIILLM